ncbi:unnamed protein product, partial [Ranitomeya imitator]
MDWMRDLEGSGGGTYRHCTDRSEIAENLFCSLDRWVHLNMDDIRPDGRRRRSEELDEMRQQKGQVRGKCLPKMNKALGVLPPPPGKEQ